MNYIWQAERKVQLNWCFRYRKLSSRESRCRTRKEQLAGESRKTAGKSSRYIWQNWQAENGREKEKEKERETRKWQKKIQKNAERKSRQKRTRKKRKAGGEKVMKNAEKEQKKNW